MTAFGPLVSTQWAAEHLGEPDVKLIDGSWRMPGEAPAVLDFSKRHIEGAVFFDLDDIVDKQSTLPHMTPPPDQFETQIGALGISENDKVIVYDDAGCFSAPRVWWTFRTMGHKNVAVMDGGLPKWIAERRPLTNTPAAVTPRAYKAAFNAQTVCNADLLKARLNKPDMIILDARPEDRFLGATPEPRAGLRTGHMPGATSLPYGLLLNSDQTFRPSKELAALFKRAGVHSGTSIVTTCGSGVTAAIVFLALELVGHCDHKLYDGSWAEWGDSQHDAKEFPVVAGTN